MSTYKVILLVIALIGLLVNFGMLVATIILATK